VAKRYLNVAKYSYLGMNGKMVYTLFLSQMSKIKPLLPQLWQQRECGWTPLISINAVHNNAKFFWLLATQKTKQSLI
jgi:hypothetical protein